MSEKNHRFNFDGGELLCHISATWFVSYAYYEHCDRTHKNWEKFKSRVGDYNKWKEFHRGWLEHVVNMNPHKLGTNKIGLTGEEVIEMAKKVLENWKKMKKL
ncbi:MAG: hypothetical protein IKP37_14140 [Paludibacteraceae bacterium]|nr:hypothetical protein [Paludibacteraceae bacterium]